MFRDRERELYERLLAEKDRTILALADEVEWHRAQTGTYMGTPAVVAGAVPAPTGEVPDHVAALEQLIADGTPGRPGQPYLNEDEEELAWQLAHGADPDAVRASLAQIRALDTIPFEPQ